MHYYHEPSDARLVMEDGKAKVFKGPYLMYRGNGPVGLSFFIDICNHHPDVVAKFQDRLNLHRNFKESHGKLDP